MNFDTKVRVFSQKYDCYAQTFLEYVNTVGCMEEKLGYFFLLQKAWTNSCPAMQILDEKQKEVCNKDLTKALVN